MILLIIATLFTMPFIYGVIRSRPYNYLTENLDGGDYPLKSLYSVGFALNNHFRPFRVPAALHAELVKYASILYGETYAVYYAEVAWAQFLTFALMASGVIFAFGSFLGSDATLIFFIIGAVMIYVFWNMSISKMKDTISQRADECLSEFPNAVGKMALLINSGMVLRDAWKLTAENPRGQLYALMRMAVDSMNNGASDIEAIYRFGVQSDSQEIKRFASTVIQTLEKGSGGLADYLLEQSSSLLLTKRQNLLQKGEVASGKLIAPIGMMFGGVMLIVLAVTLGNFSAM